MSQLHNKRTAPQPGTDSQDPEAGFLPDICSLRGLFAVVVGAELLAIVLVLGSGKPVRDFWHSLGLLSLYLQWIALSGVGLLCLLQRRLSGHGNLMLALLAWGLLLAVTALVSEVAWLLFQYLGQERQLGPDGHPGFLFKSLGVAAIVGALLLRYLYLHHQWRLQLLAESEARLQALQSRIRPHFLFNSMNTIASLIATRPELAEEVVQDLADLFRVCLSDVKRGSTLGEELELARRYLHIEEQRLGERLRLEWDLQDDLPLDARVPSLVLQPLLENAVYHGIEPAVNPGVIRVSGRYRRGQINLSMRNSLPPEGSSRRRSGNQLALVNIRQRLDGMFQGRASLTESRVDGDYQVRLVLPHPGGDA